jgi:hypothetical protein
MTLTRFMLGIIGVFGFLGWCLFSWFWYVFMGWGDGFVSSEFSIDEWVMAIAPLVAFLFYLAIMIRPCRVITALSVGIVVHIPLVFVVVPFLVRGGPTGPVYALALLPGFLVWIAYVYQLSHHDETVLASWLMRPEYRRNALDVGPLKMKMTKEDVLQVVSDPSIHFSSFDEASKRSFLEVWENRRIDAIEYNKREDLLTLAEKVLDFVSHREPLNLRLYGFRKGDISIGFLFDVKTTDYLQII